MPTPVEVWNGSVTPVSTLIRPPSTSFPGTSGVDGSSDVSRAEGGEADAVRAPAGSVGHVDSTGAASQVEAPTAAWLRQLETGEVTGQQAVEGLVRQALEAHGGAALRPAQRAELEQVLRAALLDDPVLRELIGGG